MKNLSSALVVGLLTLFALASSTAATTLGAAALQEDAAAQDSASDDVGASAQKATAAAEGLRDMLIEFLSSTLGVPAGVAALISKVAIFLAILILFKILSSVAKKLVGGALNRSNLAPTKLLHEFLTGTAAKLVLAIGLVMALAAVGINVAPLLAGVGVLGFVVGFALQDTLGNFAAGVMILLYRPFDVGDAVTAGGVTGKVKSMSLVSTTICTPDNQVQIVPNGKIWGGVITNVTANDTRRVDLVASIGYSDDIEKAEEVLAKILDQHELVLKDPAPVIKVNELADSSVNLVVRPWCKTSDYWNVHWDLTKAIKTEFDKSDINIPYPQQNVYLHRVG